MSGYEFWDELGRIFNAVVAYQEKNLEFNKRFISPWIRLGNVFEQQDRNKEAISAYEKAIEIDSDNPQNWFEVGNLHFKTENHREAIKAFKKAIELDPGFGWAHSNLALTLVATGDTEQAITHYLKGIELLQDSKDKAVAWNRLGNAYRKIDRYDAALEAFHKADELDRDNGGFRDNLDQVPDGPTVMQAGPEGSPAAATALNVRPIELIVVESGLEDAAARTSGRKSILPDGATPEAPAAPLQRALPAEQSTAEMPAEKAAPKSAAATSSEAPRGNPSPRAGDETVTVVVQETIETFTQTAPVTQESPEKADRPLSLEAPVEPADNAVPQAIDIVTSEGSAPSAQATGEPAAVIGPAESPEGQSDRWEAADSGAADAAQQIAYEEFLKDSNEPVHLFQPGGGEEDEPAASPEPVATLDPSGELQIEMDTKNAHVWNELGNVYFNTNAYDDAIVAYSKAIELDRWFAWPYSNLALAYVQRRRFVEAILLYQRSIELFANDKDKAISWNRLGNVYRRLNDYENAISAYQRADALDPDNSTLSLQSRFSLLGNYAADQKPSYVS